MYGHLRKDPDLTPTFRASGFGSAYDGERPDRGRPPRQLRSQWEVRRSEAES